MTRQHLIPVLIILMLGMIESLSGLRCFECGIYVPPESVHLAPGLAPGKIFPCYNLTIGHLKECKESQTSCMKYKNGELEVLQCAETCIEDVHSYSEREIHCCNDDACNTSFPSLHKSSSLTLAVIVVSSSLISILLILV